MIDHRIQRLTEWLSTPPEERVPKTQVALAKELGVHETQLSRWRKELDLQTATPPSEIAQFMKYVWEGVKAGKNPMWARIYSDIKKLGKEETKGAEFTANDYINIGIKTIEQLRTNYREGSGSCSVCGQHKPLRQDSHLDTEPKYEEN